MGASYRDDGTECWAVGSCPLEGPGASKSVGREPELFMGR